MTSLWTDWKALENVKGIILNGGENRVVADGKAVDIDPALYDCGYPVMAINHPTAKCEQKFDSVPAQAVLKDFVLNPVQGGNQLEYEEFH